MRHAHKRMPQKAGPRRAIHCGRAQLRMLSAISCLLASNQSVGNLTIAIASRCYFISHTIQKTLAIETYRK